MGSSARVRPRNPQAPLAPHARQARQVLGPALGHPPRSSLGLVAQALPDVQPSHNWPRNPARTCRHLPPLLPGDPRTPSSSKGTPRAALSLLLTKQVLAWGIGGQSSPSVPTFQTQVLFSDAGQTPPPSFQSAPQSSVPDPLASNQGFRFLLRGPGKVPCPPAFSASQELSQPSLRQADSPEHALG